MADENASKRPHEDDDKEETHKSTKVESECDTKNDELGDLPEWFTPALKDKLKQIQLKGQLLPGDLDKNVLDSMRDFNNRIQLEILEKFGETDLAGIRNKTAFLVGILKRYRGRPENMANARMGPGPSGYPIGMPMGGGPMGMNVGAPMHGSGTPQAAFIQASGVKRESLADSTKEQLRALYATGKVNESEIDDSVIEQLKTMSEDGANEAIKKMVEADLSSIRNKSGFFLGIIRRIKEQFMPQGAQANLQALSQLPYSVQMILTPLYQSGLLSQTDLEAKVLQSLALFPESTACEIAIKFAESDLAKVTNKSGWLFGIIKRFQTVGVGGAMGQPMAGTPMGVAGQYLPQSSYSAGPPMAMAGAPMGMPGYGSQQGAAASQGQGSMGYMSTSQSGYGPASSYSAYGYY